MAILIKGMEMPKSCFECPFMLHRCFCLVNPRIEFTDEEYSELKGRYSGCPLVPVPAHGDLIERDKLREKEFVNDGDAYAVVMSRDIRNAPTIIPASESEERPAFLPTYELTPRREEAE